jgi:flap endonuclease-1
MGVLLTPIVVKQTLALDDIRRRTLAVDGNGELYQFLALIRLRDGTPLRDSHGRVTSHLAGLFYRTTRLIADYDLRLVFVFDGAPPAMKAAELARRRDVKERYRAEHAAAIAAGDLATAYSKATMTSRLTRAMVAEARELLRLLGIPVVQAPSEGEAEAAAIARSGRAWAAASKDYDALLFGAPRLLRFLTISGREFLPSRGTFRPIVPEVIELEPWLAQLNVTREQLIDVAILVGTDFNDGIKGIGPKKALKLIQQHGAIEALPADLRERLADADVDAIRRLYLEPDVDDSARAGIPVGPSEPDVDGVIRFLVEEREFAKDRVSAALDRAFRERTLF